MTIERIRALIQDKGGDWPVRYAQGIFGKTIGDLDDMEVIEVVDQMLASAGRILRQKCHATQHVSGTIGLGKDQDAYTPRDRGGPGPG